MKKFALLLIFTIVALGVNAQRFISKYEVIRIGVKEGIIANQISGDAHQGFHKFGMSGGIFARKMVGKYFSAQVEMLYSEKGAKFYKIYKTSADTLGLPGYFLQLQYLEFPLMLQLNYDQLGIPGLTTEIGMSYALLFKSKEYIHVPGYNLLQTAKPFRKSDATINLGVTYNLPSNFSFSLRFTHSIVPVRDFPIDSDIQYPGIPSYYKGYKFPSPPNGKAGQQNTSITLSLLYQFIFK
jgi:Outer membrane protein beta-barrel domain